MLKVIPVHQVRLGMYIHELKGSWIDHPFWKTKFVLKDTSDLQKLQSSLIKEVVIDIDLGLDVEIHTEANPERATEAPAPVEEKVVVNTTVKTASTPVCFEEERHKAIAVIQSSKQAVANMFNDIRLGKVIDAEAVMPLVDEISSSVLRNSHALISLVRLKSVDDYTYMHSVAVCAMMTALAKELKLSETEIKQAGMAGLLHDLGKAKVPTTIINKPGALSESEFDVIRKHPEMGHALLHAANINDPVTLDVCLHHHEKVDGSGYPFRLKDKEISLFAKMGAICDVYDAVTSRRSYKQPWEPGMALKRMASWEGHFDPKIFKSFVKSIGIYPVGSIVLLKSGRLAVVVDQTENLLKPVVKVFFSTKSKVYITIEKLDLATNRTDEIVGNESAATWGLQNLDKIEQLWTAA